MKQNTRDALLELIRSYIEAHGYGPSVRELGEAAGLRSTATVQYHLRALAEEGRIVLEPGKKRAISLPKQEAPASEAAENQALATFSSKEAAADFGPEEAPARPAVPVLGTVAAGQPILAVENVEGWLPWEAGEGWFALRVKGESMKNAGILPGDKVIVRPQPTAEPGEIVVALLGDEATVKRFSRRGGHVWLLPENEAFDPIDGDEALLLGVVRGVVREYD